MSVHIVMPARRSAVPGEWVRRCSNPECTWSAFDRDLERLAVLAHEHHEQAGSGLPDDPDRSRT